MDVSITGFDLAKQVFQLPGTTAEREGMFRKKRSRKQFLASMQVHLGRQTAIPTGGPRSWTGT